MSDTISLDVNDIKSWRSIITLIVFVLTNIVVLFPFKFPVHVPSVLIRALLGILRHLRVIPRVPRRNFQVSQEPYGPLQEATDSSSKFTRLLFPMNFVTAPLIADLFLLAILAIGRQEVYDGIIGSNNIVPIDIMAFFITLAYIAISIDASGLIRYLAFRVLKWGGEVGHRLFFYLYAFFFLIGSFIGNDPIILSGTAFLAYMTRVSNNIDHPRAWIHSQFAVANIASAILVSSNPTNLVLAGAFQIKFIVYTANMIVPVVVTAIVVFPFLLYIIFAHEDLIPLKITMHQPPDDIKGRKPINPNIPSVRRKAQQEDEHHDDERGKLLSLEEVMNPFLDRGGAVFGAVVMTATLVTVLAINAASQTTGEHPVFWVTLPGAFVMLCWDLAFGWIDRKETREIAQRGRREMEVTQCDIERLPSQREGSQTSQLGERGDESPGLQGDRSSRSQSPGEKCSESRDSSKKISKDIELTEVQSRKESHTKEGPAKAEETLELSRSPEMVSKEQHGEDRLPRNLKIGAQEMRPSDFAMDQREKEPRTLVSLCEDAYRWCQETFPTVTAVIAHLPFALIPFAFCMFILVEALVSKGWVPVFAYGWDHWVDKTGVVGAIGGMGFLSVILCNFAGTNIGTTILLSRVVQAWQEIHKQPGATEISDRTFWATVYSMAIGVNYGAFSTAFSASLAGLLWRDILARKHIRVGPLEFARVNLPIIAISMTVGCAVLIGEVYIMRSDAKPYSLG